MDKPPLCNTGVKRKGWLEMSELQRSVEVTYDWISATFRDSNAYYIEKLIPVGQRIDKPKNKPQHGYNAIAVYESGAIIMWHSNREEMGYHISLSGSALRWIADKGMNCLSVLSEIKRLGGRTSRIDIAIDASGYEFNPSVLSKSTREPYHGKGRTPQFTNVGDVEDGWTIYVGSRSSDQFLRIYDKAKEMGIEGENLTRIELECKGALAHYVGWELAGKTAHEAYVFASTKIRTMVDFNSSHWKEVMTSETVEISLPKKTDRDTMLWLVKSCAPALAKQIAAKPSEDVIGQFWQALRQELALRNIEVE